MLVYPGSCSQSRQDMLTAAAQDRSIACFCCAVTHRSTTDPRRWYIATQAIVGCARQSCNWADGEARANVPYPIMLSSTCAAPDGGDADPVAARAGQCEEP